MTRKQTAAMFSSARGDWRTPKDLYDALNTEFKFTTDAAATADDALCAFYCADGLREPWYGNVWCNPPYSRNLGDWVKRAYDAAQTGLCAVSVLLVPARTDTEWWATYALKATEIRFIRGRIRFGGAKHNAPFPSCLLIFRGAV